MSAVHSNRLRILAPLFLVLTLAATGQGGWTLTGSLPSPSRDHVATLLNDGRVLIIGGTGGGTVAQLYDPADGMFHPAGNTLLCHQQGATATLLPDGKVLIVGGPGCGSTGAEIYDPVAGTFSLTGSSPNLPQISHQTATLLPNGKVLIAGGQANFSNQGLASAELFDPGTGMFTPTGSMSIDRVLPSATPLHDGRVLIAGGTHITSPGNGVCLSSAEIYEPASGTFIPVGNMNRARCGGYWTQAPLLNNGRVLFVGGQLFGSPSAELFDPLTESFIPTGNMTVDRDVPSATLLFDGRVLVAGGITMPAGTAVTISSAEIYDPASDTFISITDMNAARQQHTATLLQNGQVLVTGGFDFAINSDLALAELFSASPAVTVDVDIKPGRPQNRIELEKNVCRDDDNLRVAILTTPDFDAQTVDASTVKLGDPLLNGTASALRSRIRDVDLDGDLDMVLAFPLCELVTNEALNTSSTELLLTGRTLDGNPIMGKDLVKVVRDD